MGAGAAGLREDGSFNDPERCMLSSVNELFPLP